jgi:hypothetical protein
MHFFSIFLQPFDISFKLLRESTSYFGYNPRECFASGREAILRRKINVLETNIKKYVDKETHSIMQLVTSSLSGDIDISHRIFQIYPPDRERIFSECRFEPVSSWALDVLLKEFHTYRADALAEFYRQISGMTGAEAFKGFVFERLALRYLDTINDESKLSIRPLTSSNQMTWTYRGPIGRFTFQESTVSDKITEAVQNKGPVHLVPLAPNFPSIDSIVYDPKEVLTCIQATISRKHPIAVSGLQRIQGWLKLGSELAHLRPSDDRRWRFIFIVPSDMASTFKLQQFAGDSDRGEWAGKVDQYVLGFDVSRVFSAIGTGLDQAKKSKQSSENPKGKSKETVAEHDDTSDTSDKKDVETMTDTSALPLPSTPQAASALQYPEPSKPEKRRVPETSLQAEPTGSKAGRRKNRGRRRL